MSYRIAGIDVHKRMLAVVITDVGVEGEYQFERRRFGTQPSQLQELAEWLVAQEVEEAVVESTAQYWRPVWSVLERTWRPRRRQREGAGLMSGTLHRRRRKQIGGQLGGRRIFPTPSG
jgi:hypothetical protein